MPEEAPFIHAFHVAGQIGHEWIYSNNLYGRFTKPYLYEPWDPNPNPEGPPRRWKDAVALWQTLTQEQKDAWMKLARKTKVSTFNAFIQENMLRYYRKASIISVPNA